MMVTLAPGIAAAVRVGADEDARRNGNLRQGRALVALPEHPARLGIGRDVVGEKHPHGLGDDIGMRCLEGVAEPARLLERHERLQVLRLRFSRWGCESLRSG